MKPKSTELFECYKPTQLSQHLAELAILPISGVPKQLMLSKNLNVPSNKLLVVLKCTTQVMPGITQWIDVQVQEQSIVTDFENDDAVCSTNVSEASNNLVTLEQSTEQSVPQHSCISAKQATLQHNGDPHCLSMVVPNENMIIDEQCDFADGLCNCEELSKVPIMNWGTQPQVLIKGTVVGHVEQASIVGMVIQFGKIIGKNYLNIMMKPWLECVRLRIIWISYDSKLRSVIIALMRREIYC